MKQSLLLHNDVREIPALAEFVESIAESAGVDPALSMSLNLAMEEAVTNVMMYAYPEGQEGLVEVEADGDGSRIVFVIRDSGMPFDPTAAPETDITLGIEDRPIGGLGIFLVRQIMDSVEYVRAGDRNILKLTKNIT